MNASLARGGHRDADGTRAEILAQHAGLRETLIDLRALTDEVLAGRGPGAVRLRAVVGGLRLQFERHLAYEEAYLAPVLEHADPWGPERVKHLFAEHVLQRQELARAEAKALEASNLRAIALALQRLIDDVLADMEHEERGLLASDILRDDLVAVDQQTG
jgi:hypothetical protein